MLSNSLLLINKNLNRPAVFSGILTNGPKQKLTEIKLNTLRKHLIIWGQFFQNGCFWSKTDHVSVSAILNIQLSPN